MKMEKLDFPQVWWAAKKKKSIKKIYFSLLKRVARQLYCLGLYVWKLIESLNISSNSKSKKITCSPFIIISSWTAFSIPSLVPWIVIWSELSPIEGTWILVAVSFSNSFSRVPDLPKIHLWCSFGIVIDVFPCKQDKNHNNSVV